MLMSIVDLSNWLVKYMRDNDLSQSDLSRTSNVSRQIISNYISGKVRKPDEEILSKIARAVKQPPEFMFRLSGLLPPELQKDETLERIEHLYSTLKDPVSKQRVVDYIELLKTQEEKGSYNAPKNSATQSV